MHCPSWDDAFVSSISEMQLPAGKCTVNADLTNTDLTTFRVYVSEYFHHVVRSRLGLDLNALVN